MPRALRIKIVVVLGVAIANRAALFGSEGQREVRRSFPRAIASLVTLLPLQPLPPPPCVGPLVTVETLGLGRFRSRRRRCASLLLCSADVGWLH
jgi:hypothetical protein